MALFSCCLLCATRGAVLRLLKLKYFMQTVYVKVKNGSVWCKESKTEYSDTWTWFSVLYASFFSELKMFWVDIMEPYSPMGRPPREKHTLWRYCISELFKRQALCCGTRLHFFFFFPCSFYLLLCLPWQYIHLHHSRLSFSLSVVWELVSVTNPSLVSFMLLFPLLNSSPCLHLFCFSLTCSYLLSIFPTGEPSWSPGNGNHTPDCRGYFRAYICHGWEFRIPHKGLFGLFILWLFMSAHTNTRFF